MCVWIDVLDLRLNYNILAKRASCIFRVDR